MEAIVRPVSWKEFPLESTGVFEALRSPAGEQMILNDNLFVEALLPGGVLTPLAPDVHQEYRRPFIEAGESRRPTLTWARQIPIDGNPTDVVAIVADYSQWMAENAIPKLFINADPGATLVGAQRDFCRTWPNQAEVTVPGIHFIQEDSAEQIGQALAGWIRQRLLGR
jgi:haloalkane dehalogenase